VSYLGGRCLSNPNHAAIEQGFEYQGMVNRVTRDFPSVPSGVDAVHFDGMTRLKYKLKV